MNGSTNMQQSRTAMILMFVVAAGMLIGAISVFTKAWNQSAQNAELRAKNPPPPPITMPGEKPKEPEPPKPATIGEAFSLASANPWFWWTLLNTVVLAGLGFFYLGRKPVATLPSEQEVEDRQWGKLGYFAMISLIGFFTVACLAIPYTWLNSGELLSREGWTSKMPWLIVLGYVIGLGSMFGSLLAIKSEERNSAALRRWIYGYNAFLGALLFLSILGVLNAWFALYGPEPSDWTQSNIYSLSPATKKLMKSMEKPVHAYVILEDDFLLKDVMIMLNSSRKQTSQLEVTEIPMLQKYGKEIEALFKKYDMLFNSPGILLVQDPGSDKPLTTFIKQDDLEGTTPGIPGQTAGRRFFKGESAVYAALRDFRQEKKKVTIYFTQDSGELSIDEAAARAPKAGQVARTILNVKRRLEKAGYVVKALNLGEQSLGAKETVKVPDDALAVIVADPLRMTPEKAAVLDAYLKRPKAEGVEQGKLMAFFDPHFAPDGKVLPTGLESLLGTYGVQVGQDVIYSILSRDTDRDPTNIFVTPIPQLGIDPDIQDSMEALISNSTNRVEFHEVRSVKPIPAVAGFDVKGLLYAYTNVNVPGPNGPRRAIWLETVNRPKPIEYVQGLLKSNDILKLDFTQVPPSVAVTVRNKGAQQPPQNPMAQPPPAKLGEPRMVVFGDATFLSDSEVQTTADLGSNMVLSTLAWVRGKPELDSGDVQPKERKAYRLSMDKDTFDRLVWLPPVWLLVTVILAGVGVAILRRQ